MWKSVIAEVWFWNSLAYSLKTRSPFQMKLSKRRTWVGLNNPKHIRRTFGGQYRISKGLNITKPSNRGDSRVFHNTGTTNEASSNSHVGTTQCGVLTNGSVLKRSRTVELDTQGMVTTWRRYYEGVHMKLNVCSHMLRCFNRKTKTCFRKLNRSNYKYCCYKAIRQHQRRRLIYISSLWIPEKIM